MANLRVRDDVLAQLGPLFRTALSGTSHGPTLLRVAIKIKPRHQVWWLSLASEALFTRFTMELWRRRALGCLGLNREKFSKRLEQRGWSDDTKTHEWSKDGKSGIRHGEPVLFRP